MVNSPTKAGQRKLRSQCTPKWSVLVLFGLTLQICLFRLQSLCIVCSLERQCTISLCHIHSVMFYWLAGVVKSLVLLFRTTFSEMFNMCSYHNDCDTRLFTVVCFQKNGTCNLSPAGWVILLWVEEAGGVQFTAHERGGGLVTRNLGPAFGSRVTVQPASCSTNTHIKTTQSGEGKRASLKESKDPKRAWRSLKKPDGA